MDDPVGDREHDDDMDDECREYGMCRIGLEGADRCGLGQLSLSLLLLLGGVGGSTRESMFTVEKERNAMSNQSKVKTNELIRWICSI